MISFAGLPQSPDFGDTWVLCLARLGLPVRRPASRAHGGIGLRRAACEKTLTESEGFVERKQHPVVMIRLARFGARKQPYYRIVAIEKDRARNGRSIEVVGTYTPRTSPATVDLKRERIEHWTNNGAQLSERVAKLLAAYAPAASAA